MQRSTICAISTPVGTGGIGIVRLSGPDAVNIAEKLFAANGNKSLKNMRGYTGTLGRIFDGQGELDDAIAYVYRSPASYTGEDVVELSCHGSRLITETVLRLCVACGAEPAAPGEFTKRAFLNGKMNLSEAEAVIDLINAQTDTAMRAAYSARSGALSQRIDEIVNMLLEQSAHLAAWSDYPEEDIEEVQESALCPVLCNALHKMEELLLTRNQGTILREGVDTVIVGRPNVGKSTLMNLLSGGQRSIVTPIPGTTRDVVEETVSLGSCMLRLADTAGIHETADPVEQIGVQRARERMGAATLVLAVFDSSDVLTPEDCGLLEQLKRLPCVAVINKVDLPTLLDIDVIRRAVPQVVLLSAETGAGKDDLQKAIEVTLGMDGVDASAAILFTERQYHCMSKAREALQECIHALREGLTLDAVEIGIEEALDALLSLTGKRAGDAVINQVFARFCVGK